MTRTVWDGDQVLHEISAPSSGTNMERDTGHVNAYAGPYFYGRMTYVHGGGIDQPLVAVRHEYSDSLTFAARIFPQTNYRGQYDGGTGNACVTINQQSVNPLPTHPEWEFPNAEPTPPDNPADGGGTVQHCVVVDWPGKSMWPTMERKSTWYYTESWVGSLLLHSRDPSGQYYRRNRFYDGSSGRFTQEDPIGIAGGLNVYGYANGDPISYSDPYGLSALCCTLPMPRSPLVRLGVAIAVLDGPQPGPADLVAIGVVGTVAGGVYLRNRHIQGRIDGEINVIEEHFAKLAGTGPPSGGDPNDPRNRDKWKNDIRRHIREMGRQIDRLTGERNRAPRREELQRLQDRLNEVQ